MIITTSRKPSRRTRTLGRDLSRVLNGVYVTRGKANLGTLAEKARNDGEFRIIILSDIHGNPGKIQSIVVTEDSWHWHPLIINLSGVSLQREVLASQGVRIRKVSLPDLMVENHTNEDIVDFFQVSLDPESKNKMLVEESRITFYMGSREIGPRLLVKEWYHAGKDRI